MNLHVYLGLSLLLLTFNAGSTVLNQAADAQGDFSPYVSAATTEFIKLIVAALLLSKDWCTSNKPSINIDQNNNSQNKDDDNALIMPTSPVRDLEFCLLLLLVCCCCCCCVVVCPTR